MSNSKFFELIELNPKAIVLEEFDSAYVGYGTKAGIDDPVAVYDVRQMLKIIAESIINQPDWVKEQDVDSRDALENEAIGQALEFLEYNTIGVDYGEHGPIFLHYYLS